ncbi:MAG TPA: hypothetical protein VGM96_00440 [Reyranella sp.]|jgi:hypothetical protein
MVKQERDCELGTEELEQGLRPAAVLDFAKIATTAVALLLVFNSVALVDWTRQSRPGPVIAALEQPALRWHAAMERLGTAGLFERLHALTQGFS